MVAEGHVPCVVGVLADRSGVVFEGAAGFRHTGRDEPATVDTVFRIASMTKLMTSVAVLQLVERGQLDLDAEVASLVPQFGTLQVLDGFRGDEPRAAAAAGRGARAAAARPTRPGWATASGTPTCTATRSSRRRASSRAAGATRSPTCRSWPIRGRSSTTARRSTGPGWWWRRLSGRTLDAYWREEVFGPLGMADTTVLVDADALARTAAVHIRQEDGAWNATDIDYYAPGSGAPEFFAGGHCLYSTAHDCLRLQRALLAGGTLDGVRVLGEAMVDEMFRDHLGADRRPGVPARPRRAPARTSTSGRASSWSLGQMLTTARSEGLRKAGSGGWIGLFNTVYWIDRASGLAGGFYTSTLPFYEARVVEASRTFERACYVAARRG